MGKLGLGDLNDEGERCVTFGSFHPFVIGGPLFDRSPAYLIKSNTLRSTAAYLHTRYAEPAIVRQWKNHIPGRMTKMLNTSRNILVFMDVGIPSEVLTLQRERSC